MQLGVTSQTNPALAGGGRFTSVNPDITFTWLPLWNLQFYGEVYGQSRTGPGLGSGFDADDCVQYLLTPNCEVDLEEGVRLSGNLGGFTHYLGQGWVSCSDPLGPPQNSEKSYGKVDENPRIQGFRQP